MKFIEKLKYIQENNFNEWVKTRAEVKEKLSNSQSMFCICGRLATGLHEMGCRKFEKQVTIETVKKLEYLIKI